MANTGGERSARWAPTRPIAALSDKPRLLFDYFSQLFAQVTNPPLDAIREELVTSLSGTIGPRPTCSSPTPASCRQVVLPVPRSSPTTTWPRSATSTATATCPGFITHVSAASTTSRAAATALAAGIDEICARCRRPSRRAPHHRALRPHSTAELAPIPSLLLTGAVHHHLVREKTRTQVGLLVEAGDVREVHHVALLVGYGAAAVNPYLAMESVEDLAREGYYVKVEPEQAVTNLIKASARACSR
jgi:glutamate synthase (NADPH/NADH) large chain